MSTEEVQKYFDRFTIKDADEKATVEVIWINDSSCVIKFQSE